MRGFKATQEATIPLDRVTILVGPNGCGTSSVLEAIHGAARAASYVLPKNTKEMVSFERLDYVPSSEPLSTLHKGELKSDATSTPVEIVFSHRPVGGEAASTTIRIRAARNRGGITAYMDGGAVVTPYKQRFQFITAYIPGLAGLSEKESILAQPTLRRQAASGDAGGVLRNILLNLRSRRIGANRVMFKIDTYDRSMRMYSPDPRDPTDKRFLEKVREPSARDGAALHLLQLRPHS